MIWAAFLATRPDSSAPRVRAANRIESLAFLAAHRRNGSASCGGDRSSEMEPLRQLRLLGSGPQLETPLPSSLMLQLAKVLEWLLGPTLPDRLERQPTKPGESAPPARRSRPVQPSVVGSAAEAKAARKPRHRTPMPNTRQFGLPTQGKPAGQKPKFQRDETYERLPGVGEALAAIDAGAPVVLVVGRAGTGKTRLVHYLRERPGGERQAGGAP